MNIETAESVYELISHRKLIVSILKDTKNIEFFQGILQEIDKQIKEIQCT